jgi:hypothetical protein
MNKSTRLIVTAAALAGLYTGSFALRAPAEDTSSSSSSAKDDSKGQASDKSAAVRPQPSWGASSSRMTA